MNNVLIHNRKTLKIINNLLRTEFCVNADLEDLDNFALLKNEWLVNIFKEKISIADLIQFTRRNFRYVELYHSCGPSSLKPYYSNGIEPLNISRIEEELTSLLYGVIFRSPETLKLGFEKARKFISNMYWRHEICLHTDKRRAIDEVGFSSFGGEYVAYIISEIPQGEIKDEILEILSNKLIPTLFTVRLPLEKLSNRDIQSYLDHLICIWIEIYVLKRFKFEDCSYNDCTHNQKNTIESNFIYRHEHPRSWLGIRKPFYCDICKKSIP
ncbi:hypothetical protein B0B39_18460 (plasmid) [Legionella longbeachae]|uniref:hypothetical protein n=1 Tax=Legionella longbeachae TaxID=450 RepID=UPI000A1C0CF0|nr:hypothetical protein [Legionella longbeachae]ARM35518.1 hypothetical protein B0B39_18460 [Legionella longbeachae]